MIRRCQGTIAVDEGKRQRYLRELGRSIVPAGVPWQPWFRFSAAFNERAGLCQEQL